MRKRFLCPLIFLILIPRASLFALKAAKKSAGAASELSLSNGIPLFLKNSPKGGVSLCLVIEGGVLIEEPHLAGREEVALELLARSISERAGETVNVHAEKDFSVLELLAGSGAFSSALAVFADGFLHPRFSEEDFSRIMGEKKDALSKSAGTAQSVLSETLRREAYKGSPYETSVHVTAESAEAIARSDVESCWKRFLCAERIKIVAVGDFSGGEGAFRDEIDAAFGSASDFSEERPHVQKAADGEGEGKSALVQTQHTAGGESCAACYFAAPQRFSSDYTAFAIASMILDDILFDKMKRDGVRVQSLGCGVMGGKELLGVISVSNAADIGEVLGKIDEALAYAPTANDVRKVLKACKERYIASLAEQTADVSAVAQCVVASIEHSDGKSPDEYLSRPALVEKTTAKAVADAYKRYFSDAARSWIVVRPAGQESEL